MRNPFSKFFKEYFNYSKRDRNAIIVFIILICIGIIINEIIKHLPTKSDYNYLEFARELEELEKNQNSDEKLQKRLFTFNPNTITSPKLDSLKLPDFVKRNLLSYREAGGEFLEPDDLNKLYGMNDSIFQEIEKYISIPKEIKTQSQADIITEEMPEGVFDPNFADKKTLLYFGFNNFQADNLIRYRETGGKFYQFSDLLKIYGIDTLNLNKISKHIIFEKVTIDKPIVREVELVIELNRADSVQLTQLNGIGSVFATRILKYRDLLGGFYKSSQLLEIYNFTEETYDVIKNNLKVDSTLVKKIRINFAEYNELIRHPYLNSEQVNSILTYRDKNGAFNDIAQLNDIPGIDTTIVRRIAPYITCR